MTASHTPSANRTRAASRRPAITALISALHRSIADIIIDPRDEAQYHRADDLCQEIWQECTTSGQTPWRYCLDRYCSCKLMLSEWEPDQLEIFDRVAAEVGWPQRRPGASRRLGH